MLKRFLKLTVLSIIIATGLFFINSGVIVTTWVGILFEIILLTIPVLIILYLLYFANRALVKTAKGIKKKKPSQEEGPKI